MKLLKIIFLVATCISVSSCKNNSFNADTATYKIEMKKADYFHNDYTNYIQTTPLNINAQNIKLKEIFGILIKSDTSNIRFDNERLQKESFNLVIEQKVKNISINEDVLNKLMNEFNLKLIVNKYQSYSVIVEDSLKYLNFRSKSKNEVSSVTYSKDSIQVNNCNLNRLVEVLNSEFLEKSTYNMKSERITYKWKKTSFEKLKLQMKNDLGIDFLNINNDRIIFSIKNN